jgi:hypothetical protein
MILKSVFTQIQVCFFAFAPGLLVRPIPIVGLKVLAFFGISASYLLLFHRSKQNKTVTLVSHLAASSVYFVFLSFADPNSVTQKLIAFALFGIFIFLGWLFESDNEPQRSSTQI